MGGNSHEAPPPKTRELLRYLHVIGGCPSLSTRPGLGRLFRSYVGSPPHLATIPTCEHLPTFKALPLQAWTQRLACVERNKPFRRQATDSPPSGKQPWAEAELATVSRHWVPQASLDTTQKGRERLDKERENRVHHELLST